MESLKQNLFFQNKKYAVSIYIFLIISFFFFYYVNFNYIDY